MNKQPEALRIAEWFEGGYGGCESEAAAELRRLHEVNQKLLEALKAIRNSAYMPQALIGLIDEAIAKGEQA